MKFIKTLATPTTKYFAFARSKKGASKALLYLFMPHVVALNLAPIGVPFAVIGAMNAPAPVTETTSETTTQTAETLPLTPALSAPAPETTQETFNIDSSIYRDFNHQTVKGAALADGASRFFTKVTVESESVESFDNNQTLMRAAILNVIDARLNQRNYSPRFKRLVVANIGEINRLQFDAESAIADLPDTATPAQRVRVRSYFAYAGFSESLALATDYDKDLKRERKAFMRSLSGL